MKHSLAFTLTLALGVLSGAAQTSPDQGKGFTELPTTMTVYFSGDIQKNPDYDPNIIITLPDIGQVTQYREGPFMARENGDGITYVGLTLNNGEGVHSAVFDLSKLRSTYDKWTLYIPHGYFIYDDEPWPFDEYYEVTINVSRTGTGVGGTTGGGSTIDPSATVVPYDFLRMEASAFKGLQLKGLNFTVKDASGVLLYKKWYDIDNPISEAEPYATGELGSSSLSEKIITFGGVPMYDGPYTIIIPESAVSGVEDREIQFFILGNPMPIEEFPVFSDPEQGEVEGLTDIRIYWDDYVILTAARQKMGGSLQTPDGNVTPIEFTLRKEEVLDESDDGLGGAVQGQYTYYLQYIPDQPLTEAGDYKVTLNAGAVKVYIRDDNQPLNPAVDLYYHIDLLSGVQAVEATETDSVYYDLQGRRVRNPKAGIYVVKPGEKGTAKGTGTKILVK